MSSERSDRRARWMERAQAGDREAYRALLEDVSGELRRFLARRLREPHDREDVLQEVLLAVHRARHTYMPSRPFEPWLFAIARNTAVDAGRRRRGRARFEVAVDELPEVGAEGAAAVPLEEALGRLPPAQREAVRLLQVEGLSAEAAAARVGISPGALRVRAHRGYRALKALLGGGR